VKHYGPPVVPHDGPKDGKNLCHLCACSLAGNAVDYPSQYDATTLRTICAVGNMVIDECTGRVRPTNVALASAAERTSND
jgi:hypothetical protein